MVLYSSCRDSNSVINYLESSQNLMIKEENNKKQAYTGLSFRSLWLFSVIKIIAIVKNSNE